MRLGAVQHGAFSRNQATDRQVSAKQLRRLAAAGDIEPFGPAAFTIPDPRCAARQQMMAATLSIPGSAVAGRSACLVHELGSDAPPQSVELWVPNHRNRKRLPGVTICTNSGIRERADTVVIDGIRTVSAAVGLCGLGRSANHDELRHALDDFERRFDPMWLEQTVARLGGRGRRGVSELLSVMKAPERVVGVTGSWMERLLADLTNRPGIPLVRLQYEVRVGRRVYRIDVAIPSIRLGLEAHSRRFHFGAAKNDSDNRRDHDLASAGWLMLYITWSQLHDRRQFVDLLERTVAQRRRDLSVR